MLWKIKCLLCGCIEVGCDVRVYVWNRVVGRVFFKYGGFCW